jgi:o-succinylbenzoate---CoA ligase
MSVRQDGGTPLPDWLARRAAISPQQPALLAADLRWTFAELDQQASAAATALAGRGVQSGDRIALLVGNRAEFVAVVHGAPRIGAVLVPLNLRLAVPELAWQLTDVGASLLLHDSARAPLAAALQAAVPGLQVMPIDQPPGGRGTGDGDENTESTETSPGSTEESVRFALCGPLRDLSASGSSVFPSPSPAPDLHTIIYTSGTTGRPKGVMLSHGNHWWSAIGSVLNLGLRHDDVWLAVLPLFHVGGLAILIRSVVYGIPIVLHETFDPEAVNEAFDRQGITCVSLVGAMLRRVLDARGERPMPATLRCVLLGGGPAPGELLERCARQGVPVIQTYGMTETASQAATLSLADGLRKLGSAGKPLLPTELRIDREGAPAPPGTVGEILLRGPTVTLGYVNRPEETRRTLRDGWLHTGDLGYLDAEGYLYVLDRRDDLIRSGGENVSPAEVEATLLAHPAIADAGVVGIPDPRWGEVPAAAVQLRPGGATDAAALIAFCVARLAGYKVPRTIRFVDALPRNPAGKLVRPVLLGTLLKSDRASG